MGRREGQGKPGAQEAVPCAGRVQGAPRSPLRDSEGREMKFYRMEQGSGEWYAKRLGIPTASNFHKIITPKTAELSKSAVPYMYKLLAERLLNEPSDDELGYVQWVRDGKDNE